MRSKENCRITGSRNAIGSIVGLRKDCRIAVLRPLGRLGFGIVPKGLLLFLSLVSLVSLFGNLSDRKSSQGGSHYYPDWSQCYPPGDHPPDRSSRCLSFTFASSLLFPLHSGIIVQSRNMQITVPLREELASTGAGIAADKLPIGIC